MGRATTRASRILFIHVGRVLLDLAGNVGRVLLDPAGNVGRVLSDPAGNVGRVLLGHRPVRRSLGGGGSSQSEGGLDPAERDSIVFGVVHSLPPRWRPGKVRLKADPTSLRGRTVESSPPMTSCSRA